MDPVGQHAEVPSEEPHGEPEPPADVWRRLENEDALLARPTRWIKYVLGAWLTLYALYLTLLRFFQDGWLRHAGFAVLITTALIAIAVLLRAMRRLRG